ncbi:MAG: DUF1080 domain-containing protein [Armatimonadetes bacterium]|nr:DUF1080 domain-containing protein [Armatimonadota bacterium]
MLPAFVGAAISFWWTPRRDTLGFQCTPLLPDIRFRVHDGLRPQPPILSPPLATGKPSPAPPDAIVLFDGTSLANFCTATGAPARWSLQNGAATPNGTGDIYSRQRFGDCELHVEWATPTPRLRGQGRGNSGVFLMERYEIQILDSWRNPTYPDGQAGSIYGQSPPTVNASRPPGDWQTFDIRFIAPRFAGERLREPAYVSVWHNGVTVQKHVAIRGDTVYMAVPRYHGAAATGAIRLQDHGNAVRFRNIWVRPLPRK